MATNNQFPPRNEHPVPISFCCLELNSEPIEHSTKAVRILQNGYVITSPCKLRCGTLLSLRMRLPNDEKGNMFWENRCTATVLGEYLLNDGVLRYKVELDHPRPC
ncbi:MAG TPA: hypothetical protein VMH20_01430 [Verrucomicrobiae bacterium]|nr:hypothetical protein [Verrucomicrobiae bacterium]